MIVADDYANGNAARRQGLFFKPLEFDNIKMLALCIHNVYTMYMKTVRIEDELYDELMELAFDQKRSLTKQVEHMLSVQLKAEGKGKYD